MQIVKFVLFLFRFMEPPTRANVGTNGFSAFFTKRGGLISVKYPRDSERFCERLPMQALGAGCRKWSREGEGL